MCGIAGFYGIENSNERHLNRTEKMISALTHRGPDGWGYYISHDRTFGQMRLLLVDLKSGDQPMITDKQVIIYNGEIFNNIELQKELEEKGMEFQKTCDAEVLLKSYEFWGEECFLRLNG